MPVQGLLHPQLGLEVAGGESGQLLAILDAGVRQLVDVGTQPEAVQPDPDHVQSPLVEGAPGGRKLLVVRMGTATSQPTFSSSRNGHLRTSKP